MSEVVFNAVFDSFQSDPKSTVFEIFPDVHQDSRGFFLEAMKFDDDMPNAKLPKWMQSSSWIKQVNRSSSVAGTVRGCHAQKGKFCQAKLVQALTSKIYDIITDARPQSATFGVTQAFVLDPAKQNMLFVPKGFLHAFAVPYFTQDALFEYWCDNVYNKQSEVGVNPMSYLPDAVEDLKKFALDANDNCDASMLNSFDALFHLFDDRSKMKLSDKDLAAQDYGDFMSKVLDEYQQDKKVWYR